METFGLHSFSQGQAGATWQPGERQHGHMDLLKWQHAIGQPRHAQHAPSVRSNVLPARRCISSCNVVAGCQYERSKSQARSLQFQREISHSCSKLASRGMANCNMLAG